MIVVNVVVDDESLLTDTGCKSPAALHLEMDPLHLHSRTTRIKEFLAINQRTHAQVLKAPH